MNKKINLLIYVNLHFGGMYKWDHDNRSIIQCNTLISFSFPGYYLSTNMHATLDTHMNNKLMLLQSCSMLHFYGVDITFWIKRMSEQTSPNTFIGPVYVCTVCHQTWFKRSDFWFIQRINITVNEWSNHCNIKSINITVKEWSGIAI